MLMWLNEVRTTFVFVVILNYWDFWRKHNVNVSKKIIEIVLDDFWWLRVDLTIMFMDPIFLYYSLEIYTHAILVYVYEGWDYTRGW